MTTPAISIPDGPTDKFSFVYYSSIDGVIEKYRLVYHVNSTYDDAFTPEAYGREKSPHTPPLVDAWAIFHTYVGLERERPEGRTVGWEHGIARLASIPDDAHRFFTFEEARAKSIKNLRHWILVKREEITRLEHDIIRLGAEG
jgi:hypothetical protein